MTKRSAPSQTRVLPVIKSDNDIPQKTKKYVTFLHKPVLHINTKKYMLNILKQ